MVTVPRFFVLVPVVLSAAACGSPAGNEVPETEDPATDVNAVFEVFVDDVFERELTFDPQLETQLGLRTERYDQWNDYTDAAAVAGYERRRADLETLAGLVDYDDLSAENRISYDVFVYKHEEAIRDFEFRKNIYVAHHLDGAALYFPVILQNQHEVRNLADAEAYVARLGAIETPLLQLAERLAEQTRTGIVAPEFSYPRILADLDNLVSGAPFDDGDDNSVYADFRDKLTSLELDGETRVRLLDSARAALLGGWRRGYDAFRDEVLAAQAVADGNDGVWEHENGDAYYQNRIRYYTTLDLDADGIHELGLREVERIQGEIRAIQEQVGIAGTLPEFFEYIRNDPNNYYPNDDAGRAAFLQRQQDLVDGIYAKVDTYFNLLPEADLDVRRVEPYRENTAGIAFYNRPSADGTRPGIYYTNLKDMADVQKYVHTAIAYHESAPGHHFQLALQQEMKGLPKFRKFGYSGAFSEGWALYAELLAKEMGFYADPFEDVGRLQNELWRAVRLVVDTGIHTRRWTREQSIDYFLNNTPLSVGDATTEIERYIARPGQALSYKIGMLKIQELRGRAEEALGTAFDIREFHDVVLQNGSLPLPILEKVVNRYVVAAVATRPQ